MCLFQWHILITGEIFDDTWAREHTLNGDGWFPEHVRVFQQLRLISVDRDDLTASVKNSAVTQPEVTHGACKRNTHNVPSMYMSLKPEAWLVSNVFHSILIKHGVTSWGGFSTFLSKEQLPFCGILENLNNFWIITFIWIYTVFSEYTITHIHCITVNHSPPPPPFLNLMITSQKANLLLLNWTT